MILESKFVDNLLKSLDYLATFILSSRSTNVKVSSKLPFLRMLRDQSRRNESLTSKDVSLDNIRTLYAQTLKKFMHSSKSVDSEQKLKKLTSCRSMTGILGSRAHSACAAKVVAIIKKASVTSWNINIFRLIEGICCLLVWTSFEKKYCYFVETCDFLRNS